MEFCLNQSNATGVYAKFDMTFTHPNAAAAVPVTCLCSKCRPV